MKDRPINQLSALSGVMSQLQQIAEEIPNEDILKVAPSRENLEVISMWGEEFKYSPPTVVTKDVEGEAIRTPLLPKHINDLRRLEVGQAIPLEAIVKSLGNEFQQSVVRANALEIDGYWGKVFTSNRQPEGTYSLNGDGIFVNEEWASARSIDSDGDAMNLVSKVGRRKITEGKLAVKYPNTKRFAQLVKREKLADRIASLNDWKLADLQNHKKWAELAELTPVWSDEKKLQVFRKTHNVASIGRTTNALLMMDLEATAGMPWKEKVNSWPTLIDDFRYEAIEGNMKEARGGATFALRELDTEGKFISGAMGMLTGIKGISQGKHDSAWCWGTEWEAIAYRLLTMDVRRGEVQLRETGNGKPAPTRTVSDQGLINRLHKRGILHYATIQTNALVDGVPQLACIVWLHNAKNMPTAFVDTKRDKAGSESDFLTYLAVLFPTFDEDTQRWMDPIAHMEKFFTVYTQDVADENQDENSDPKLWSESGFTPSQSFGDPFPQSRESLAKLPFIAEDLRKAMSQYISKFGCFINGQLTRNDKKQWIPTIPEHTMSRVKNTVCVHYTASYGNTERMEAVALEAYSQLPYAYYAYKPKDSRMKLYPLEVNGRPVWGEVGGNYNRYGAMRQILIATEAVDYTIAIVWNKDSEQQTYLTPSGIAKTPVYKANPQLIHTEDQYNHYCKRTGHTPTEDDRVVSYTLSGDKRYVWVVPAKDTVKYPKLIGASGTKIFTCECEHGQVTTSDGVNIDLLYPVEELISKGLFNVWMKKATKSTILVDGKECEAYVITKKLMRSCDASENTPAQWKRSYARGAWEQSLLYSAMLEQDPTWEIPKPNYEYLEELRRQYRWIMSNYFRITADNAKRLAEAQAEQQRRAQEEAKLIREWQAQQSREQASFAAQAPL